MRTIHHNDILAANKYGLKNPDAFTSYYTPVLHLALMLGQSGVDLNEQPVVSGYRYGNIPQSGISHNYRDNESERGLSMASVEGSEEGWLTKMLFEGTSRPTVEAMGILLPFTGSDGEPLIIPFGIANND